MMQFTIQGILACFVLDVYLECSYLSSIVYTPRIPHTMH